MATDETNMSRTARAIRGIGMSGLQRLLAQGGLRAATDDDDDDDGQVSSAAGWRED